MDTHSDITVLPAILDVVARRGSVAAHGELTVRTCWKMRDAVALLDPKGEVTIDLRDVRHLDAAGLVAVTAPAVALRRRGARLVIHLPLDPEARRLADLAGVLPLLSAA